LALVLEETGWRITGLVGGAVGFILYHISPDTHPGVYALEPDFDAGSAEFKTTMAGATGMPLVAGNRVEIYNNGDEFYPAMLEAIESARLSVTMEQYIFWDGEVARRFAEAFAEKARQGVPVKLLLDAIGSAILGSEVFEILAAGGCAVAWFRPIHWYTIHRANRRNHRKSLIVDGRIAFAGGSGIADHWLGNGAGPQEWRDVQISVEGPAVLAQQTGFVQNWLVATGEILGGHRFFPEPHLAGEVPVQTILSSPSSGAGAAGTMYLIALQCARRFVHIANPYFIPDSRVIALLARACRRGVKVKLMLAGWHNDTWWARQNSVRLYGRLLAAGVEIHEYQPTMLHQKTMIVDGAWATVGTANFDNRSFALNEESNVCFHDPELVQRLEAIFQTDLSLCRQVRAADWRKRGTWQRTKEVVASLAEEQM
jgi:cardiolipin synthase